MDKKAGLSLNFQSKISKFQPGTIPGEFKNAAVILLLTDEFNPKVLFLERSPNLKTHGGEICFPGGKIEKTDASPVSAALRETYEEISISPEKIKIFGKLDPLISKHGLRVFPFVGKFPTGLTFRCDLSEIRDYFMIDCESLLRKSDYCFEDIREASGIYRTHSFKINGKNIWGLTAYILVQFLNIAFSAGYELGARLKQKPL